MMFDKIALNRRQTMGLGAAAALTAGTTSISAAAHGHAAATPAELDLDFGNNIWNREAYARLTGYRDPAREKIGWFSGKAYGVVPGRKNLELCGFEGFSVIRLVPLEDGSYRKLLREVAFYTDLKTGEILETFDNPYTGETNRIVPVANDPYNYTISEFYPDPPSYGGLNTEKPPRVPFLLDWKRRGDRVLLTTDIHLYYPSALQPDKWPRESPGPMTRVSEMFRYYMDAKDLGNPDLEFIPYIGSWVRETPWFPWMLMDQAPGHCMYVCDQGKGDTLDIVPANIVEAARQIDPKFLSAPTEDYGPSLSSLENYALTQTPAPPRVMPSE